MKTAELPILYQLALASVTILIHPNITLGQSSQVVEATATAAIPIDNNNDGWDDFWVSFYLGHGIDLSKVEKDGDPDADGVVNFDEMKRFTDPFTKDRELAPDRAAIAARRLAKVQTTIVQPARWPLKELLAQSEKQEHIQEPRRSQRNDKKNFSRLKRKLQSEIYLLSFEIVMGMEGTFTDLLRADSHSIESTILRHRRRKQESMMYGREVATRRVSPVTTLLLECGK